MFVHQAQLVIRIAYAGAPLSGKTETLKALLANLHGAHSGVTVYSPLAARGRTLYFDWAQYQGGTSFAGPLQCQLTSVPGQTTLHRRRRALIEAADVVIFVVDSQADQLDANRRSLAELQPWIGRGDLPPIAVICQANKRDLSGALPLEAIREGLGLARDADLHPSTAILGEGVRVCFIAAVRACVRRAEELRALNRLLEQEPPELTGEQLLQHLRLAEGEGGPEPLQVRQAAGQPAEEPAAASAAPHPRAAAPAAPHPWVSASPAAYPRAVAPAPNPGAAAPAAPSPGAAAPAAPRPDAAALEAPHPAGAISAVSAVAAPASSAPAAPPAAGAARFGIAPHPTGAGCPARAARPAVMPFATWTAMVGAGAGAPGQHASPAAPAAPAAAVAPPHGLPAAAASPVPGPAVARRAVMPMADWVAAGGGAGAPARAVAPATASLASRAESGPAAAAPAARPLAVVRRAAPAAAEPRPVPPAEAAPSAGEPRPKSPVRVTRPMSQVAPPAAVAAMAAAAPVVRAGPGAATELPAPWLHGHESMLVDAWPPAIWQEALRAAGSNAEPPRAVGETLQARIGAGWQARAWGILENPEAARGEFRRLVSWLMRLGDVVSSWRCVVLSGEPSSWCVWQVVRQELTFDLLLRQSLEQDLLSKDAVQVLARVAADYVATAQDFALRGVELPIHLKTLAHENRSTVYSAFLPPAPVPMANRDALADLASELRPIVPPHLLGSLEVTEALRELEQLSEGRPHMVPTVELLQSLLIGE